MSRFPKYPRGGCLGLKLGLAARLREPRASAALGPDGTRNIFLLPKSAGSEQLVCRPCSSPLPVVTVQSCRLPPGPAPTAPPGKTWAAGQRAPPASLTSELTGPHHWPVCPRVTRAPRFLGSRGTWGSRLWAWVVGKEKWDVPEMILPERAAKRPGRPTVRRVIHLPASAWEGIEAQVGFTST